MSLKNIIVSANARWRLKPVSPQANMGVNPPVTCWMSRADDVMVSRAAERHGVLV
jgi:hypothetical protein